MRPTLRAGRSRSIQTRDEASRVNYQLVAPRHARRPRRPPHHEPDREPDRRPAEKLPGACPATRNAQRAAQKEPSGLIDRRVEVGFVIFGLSTIFESPGTLRTPSVRARFKVIIEGQSGGSSSFRPLRNVARRMRATAGCAGVGERRAKSGAAPIRRPAPPHPPTPEAAELLDGKRLASARPARPGSRGCWSGPPGRSGTIRGSRGRGRTPARKHRLGRVGSRARPRGPCPAERSGQRSRRAKRRENDPLPNQSLVTIRHGSAGVGQCSDSV